jgi:hypothetical protein
MCLGPGADVARSGDDEARIEILLENQHVWDLMREDVGAWVVANYPTWKLEAPTWFTSALVAAIPDELLQEVDSVQGNAPAAGAVSV